MTVDASADAWVLQTSPTSNYGDDSVMKADTKAEANARALVRFALPGAPDGCRVVDADLRLYASSSKPGRTLEVMRIAADWTEGTVTWANQPATAGPAAAAASGEGWRTWNVASQVQSMYAGATSDSSSEISPKTESASSNSSTHGRSHRTTRHSS
jgi:large repetitive protein